MSYPCPICKKELEIKSVVDIEYYFECNNQHCGYHKSKPYLNTENKDEAYAKEKKIDRTKEKDEFEKRIKKDKIWKELRRMMEPYAPDDEFKWPPPKSTPPKEKGGNGKESMPRQLEDEREHKIPDKKIAELLEKISNVGDYDIVKTITEKSSEPEFENIEKLENVHPDLKKYITNEFKQQLYKHQVDSFNKISEEKNIIIVSPTSSGKTESFLFPILNHIISNPKDEGVIAAFVYPTKALTQDQVSRIEKIAKEFDVIVERIDGDTGKMDPETNQELDKNERDKIRLEILQKKPKILLTNFDFIHTRMWRKDIVDQEFNNLFKNLKFLVIDEIHKYEGIHGAQVHHIIKRMKRVYGEFKIIGASATIHNPKKFCETLIGESAEVINGKGRAGKLTLLILYPTKIKQKELMSDLTTKLPSEGHHVLCFSNSKMAAEEIAISVEDKGGKIGVHRAGLLHTEREKVIKEFQLGKLDAVSATPTLEVGIDIGDLDAVVSEYVPYQTLKQRIGRAGRSGQDAFGFLILNPNDPISRFYYQHPDQYQFDNLDILVDPYNELIEKIHIIFAAMDKPIAKAEVEKIKEEEKSADKYNSMQRQMQELVDYDILVSGSKRMSDGEDVESDLVVNPDVLTTKDLGNFSIRDIGMSVDIKVDDKKIGEWDIPMALERLYPKAIYLHSKKVYRSTELEKDENTLNFVAKVQEATNEKNTRTQPIVEKYPTFMLVPQSVKDEDAGKDSKKEKSTKSEEWDDKEQRLDEKDGKDESGPLDSKLILDRKIRTELWFLSINKRIREQYEFDKENKKGKKMVGIQPTQSFGLRTTGILINFELFSDQFSKIPEIVQNKTGVFHALEHLLIQSANMLAGSISSNLDGISILGSNEILIFDRSTNGGNGASKSLFVIMEDVFKRALEIVEECPCDDGCPRCTHYYLCNEWNSNLNKSGAKSLLSVILNGRKYTDPDPQDLV